MVFSAPADPDCPYIMHFTNSSNLVDHPDPDLVLESDQVRDQSVTHPVKEKMKDHDICVPILGMGREVARFRRIPVLVKATTNRHDLPRTVLLAPAAQSRQLRERAG